MALAASTLARSSDLSWEKGGAFTSCCSGGRRLQRHVGVPSSSLDFGHINGRLTARVYATRGPG